MSLAILIVHYKTFILTQQALWSFYEAYPNIPLYVVENASNDGSLQQLEDLKTQIKSLHILPQAQNLHHGPGMDWGIRHIQAEQILLLDSDCILYKNGLLEALQETAKAQNAYIVGRLQRIDENGFDDLDGFFSYIHPHCALINKAQYLSLPPFEKHGAPCLKNQIVAARQGNALVNFSVQDFVFHLGRGTVRTEGYGLGMKGKWKMLLKKIGYK